MTIGDPVPLINTSLPLYPPRSTALPNDGLALLPWDPKPTPSARVQEIRALRAALLTARAQVDQALAQLAALESGA